MNIQSCEVCLVEFHYREQSDQQAFHHFCKFSLLPSSSSPFSYDGFSCILSRFLLYPSRSLQTGLFSSSSSSPCSSSSSSPLHKIHCLKQSMKLNKNRGITKNPVKKKGDYQKSNKNGGIGLEVEGGWRTVQKKQEGEQSWKQPWLWLIPGHVNLAQKS